MNELLFDECYSCILASLVLIKSLAAEKNGELYKVNQLASDLSHTCVTCIRSHEAGSILPEIADRLADESQQLVEAIKLASIQSPESLACSNACEKFVRTYHQVV